MKQTVFPMIVILSVATAALAHQGVKDPGVMARMQGMKEVGKAMGVLKDMAKGTLAYDAMEAQAAKAALTRHLGEAEMLFKEPHTDPKSEALPVIWEDYGAFSKSLDTAWAASGALKVRSLTDLRDTLPAAGQGCLDCHKTYRKKK